MTTKNSHFKELIEAKRAYDEHVYEMHVKYGQLHVEGRLTVEEAMERAIVTGEYRTQSELFMWYRAGEE
jgi:hypothetical protein